MKTEMFSVRYNFYVSKSTYYRYRADYFDPVNNAQNVSFQPRARGVNTDGKAMTTDSERAIHI